MHTYKESTGIILFWGVGVGVGGGQEQRILETRPKMVCLRCRIFALRPEPCWLIYYLVAGTFFRFLHVLVPCLLRILIYKNCPARTFITELTVKTKNLYNSCTDIQHNNNQHNDKTYNRDSDLILYNK
jgi:hypothetical protein